MNAEDLLRMIDILHREKDIPKEVLFLGLEDAVATAIRKRLGVGEDLQVRINRTNGAISVEVLNQLIRENPNNMTHAIRAWMAGDQEK